MGRRLQVRNLSKRYGVVPALSGVDFHIEAGEVLGLLGPNGAGKTTAVESVAGLTEPDAGEIEICGTDARRHPVDARGRMGIALAATALPDKITPREAVESFGLFYKRRATAADLLQRFDLTAKADAYFETLSTGQRQRLSLALAFLNEPELLILDEPSAGLDPEARYNLRAILRNAKSEGVAVLLTTHDMEEAQRLCDRVAVIHRGRIVAEGAPATLIAQSRAVTTIEIQLTGPVNIDGLKIEGNTLRLTTTDVNESLATLLPILNANNAAIAELHAQKATLEEVIADLMKAA